MATGRVGNHQNAGHIARGASKKSSSDDARSSTISGRAKSMKDSGRTKKRKDGLSKGNGNAVGGDSGTKGNWNNDGLTAGKRSKKSVSDDGNGNSKGI